MKAMKFGAGMTVAAMSLLLMSMPKVGHAKSMNKMNMNTSSSRMSNMKNNSSKNSMDMQMNMHGSKAPKGLKVAKHPKFKSGSKVIIKADHMMGMQGAKAKVIDAYQSPLYEVNYYPTNGGQEVKGHKWLVNKELKSDKKGKLHVGEKVTLKANHMKNMKGAKAKIVGIHKGPAYMINYRSTTGMNVTNHKWLAQNELKNLK